MFLESGARLNAQKYIDDILEPMVTLCNATIFTGKQWIFQQDGAPCHTARVTQNWCQENLPGFISKYFWPPSSPDLNPIDYFVWSYLEAKVNCQQHASVESLKCSLLKE